MSHQALSTFGMNMTYRLLVNIGCIFPVKCTLVRHMRTYQFPLLQLANSAFRQKDSFVGCIVRHLHYMFISEEDLVKRVKKRRSPRLGDFLFLDKIILQQSYSKRVYRKCQ